jgi:O-antigen/teichoic acid export membrane protein
VPSPEPLRRDDVGLLVIRGGTLRGLGYGIGMALTAASSVLLLRHLGVADFGRFVTVTSLIAIVSALTDVGLTTIGGRDLALRPLGEERRAFIASLMALRLVLTPLGVLAALAFALLVGYDHVLVVGVALAGIGLVLTTTQSTMALPLWVELKIGRLTSAEVLKQAVMLVGVAALVASGASLLPFFAVYIVVGAAALGVTPLLVGKGFVRRPAFDRGEWARLIRNALPVGASLVMNVVYFRVIVLLMSLVASAVATGLFATSFRVFEILFGVSSLIVSVALPALSVASEDRERLRYMLQRMTEVAVIAACYLVVIVVIVAEPALDLLGGPQYRHAAPVLRIQVFALIPVFFGQVCQIALVSIRRATTQAVANAVGLVLVLLLGLVFVPLYGATGGAIAALVAECALTVVLFVLLARCDPLLQPRLGFLWKVALAGGLAGLVLLLPSVPRFAAACAATGIYVVALVLTRAVPREVVDAFGRGRSSSTG